MATPETSPTTCPCRAGWCSWTPQAPAGAPAGLGVAWLSVECHRLTEAGVRGGRSGSRVAGRGPPAICLAVPQLDLGRDGCPACEPWRKRGASRPQPPSCRARAGRRPPRPPPGVHVAPLSPCPLGSPRPAGEETPVDARLGVCSAHSWPRACGALCSEVPASLLWPALRCPAPLFKNPLSSCSEVWVGPAADPGCRRGGDCV